MTKRILIVEHEGALALEMAAVLHADGFSTSIVSSAVDAFREMEERRPDLLFVRAELPEQNGFSLCARVRRNPSLRSIPIVLASTDSAPEALQQHAAHPSFAANAYLLAPYGMDDLRAAVHGLLPPETAPAEDVVDAQA
ncbi:MAG TPA: response regulator, partial [Vulgatibacter sp.]|nr:response regulator [Vulgatibacter sp.]